MSELISLAVLLVVAVVVGMLGQAITGRHVPGGWLGALVVGLVGAYLGGTVVPFGPTIGGIQVISAVLGASALMFILGWLGRASAAPSRSRSYKTPRRRR